MSFELRQNEEKNLLPRIIGTKHRLFRLLFLKVFPVCSALLLSVYGFLDWTFWNHNLQTRLTLGPIQQAYRDNPTIWPPSRDAIRSDDVKMSNKGAHSANKLREPWRSITEVMEGGGSGVSSEVVYTVEEINGIKFILAVADYPDVLSDDIVRGTISPMYSDSEFTTAFSYYNSSLPVREVIRRVTTGKPLPEEIRWLRGSTYLENHGIREHDSLEEAIGAIRAHQQRSPNKGAKVIGRRDPYRSFKSFGFGLLIGGIFVLLFVRRMQRLE